MHKENDLVIVPTYTRPEYLWCCLDKLHSIINSTPSGKQIWVIQDRHLNDERKYEAQFKQTQECIQYWNERLPLRFLQRNPHRYDGNTYNVMEAYLEACNTDFRYIYLVEDDVIVMPDFFRWHEYINASGDFFASVAWSINNANRQDKSLEVNDERAYMTSNTYYGSIGVCWRRKNLSHVVKHAKPEYYKNLLDYVKTTFPNSKYDASYSEQDGLIRRVMEEDVNKIVAWPYVSRCYHIGLYGYHRPDGNCFTSRMSLDIKVKMLRNIMHNAELIKERNKDFNDIVSVPSTFKMHDIKWNDLYLRQ